PDWVVAKVSSYLWIPLQKSFQGGLAGVFHLALAVIPGQYSALDELENKGQDHTNQPQHDDAGPHLGDSEGTLELDDGVAQACRGGEHFGDNHQDQGNG